MANDKCPGQPVASGVLVLGPQRAALLVGVYETFRKWNFEGGSISEAGLCDLKTPLPVLFALCMELKL